MEKISVVIPAHNEGRYIGKCLSSIRIAELKINIPVEIIVCLNRCTDNTEAVAKAHGAITVYDTSKNIAKVRNAGIKISSGDVLVTIDADSWMTPNMLSEILCRLQSGEYIGGGIKLRAEQHPLGIFVAATLYGLFRLFTGLTGGGAYWILRKDFEAIGGFDENLLSAETLAFSKKIKTLGKKKGLKLGYIKNEKIYTSTRKFDQLGNWYLFKNSRAMYRGNDKRVSDKVWYDTNR